MKKGMLVLIALLLLCSVAFAEETEKKITLWEHTIIEKDESGEVYTQPVKVTLTYKEPLTLREIENDLMDGYFGEMFREGVAPVTVAISPAEFGAHANLNDATDEELQAYLDAVAQQYEEGAHSEITKTESGNVYLAVGDGMTRSVWSVYEDTIIEIVQHHEDFSELTGEDQAFAIEILQGIWME